MNIRIRERDYLDKYKCIDHFRNAILTNYWVQGSLLYYRNNQFALGSISLNDIEQISVGDTLIIFSPYRTKERTEFVKFSIELISKYDTKGGDK